MQCCVCLEFESKCHVMHISGNTGHGVAHVCCRDCFRALPPTGPCPMCRKSFDKHAQSFEYTVRYIPDGVVGYRHMEYRNHLLVLMEPQYEELRGPETAAPDSGTILEAIAALGRLEEMLRCNTEALEKLVESRSNSNGGGGGGGNQQMLVDMLNDMFCA